MFIRSGPLAPLFQLGKLVPRLSDCFLDLESVVIRGLVDSELLEPQSEPESDYDSDAEPPVDSGDDDDDIDEDTDTKLAYIAFILYSSACIL